MKSYLVFFCNNRVATLLQCASYVFFFCETVHSYFGKLQLGRLLIIRTDACRGIIYFIGLWYICQSSTSFLQVFVLVLLSSYVDVETEFGVLCSITDSDTFINFYLIKKLFLPFCKFLETAKDCKLPFLSNIYPVWFTVRKVIFLKNWSLTAREEYSHYPSAAKINCKSFCKVGYANFGQTFFATSKRISMEILVGVGLHAWCPLLTKDL